MQRLTIATRESPLAMWQAAFVRDALQRAHPGLVVELLGVTSRADQMLDAPLAKIGGKGLFVKELENALLDGRADIAVHSIKDLPMEFPPGLELAAVCEREDPSDAFVSNRFEGAAALPAGSVVGTSSLRRECQLRARRPDLEVKFLRGNGNTRLRKLDQGEFDGIILASAGLLRLGFAERIRERVTIADSLPAVGQGALGIELRTGDTEARRLVSALHHSRSAVCVAAERAMNRRLEGGCQVPIAGYAEWAGATEIHLRGLVGRPDGSQVLRAEAHGHADDAQRLGERVAESLLSQGAGAILDAVYGR